MRHTLRSKDFALAVAAAVGISALAALAGLVTGVRSFLGFLLIALALLLLLLEIIRRQQRAIELLSAEQERAHRHREQLFRQTECLQVLMNLISLKAPLPASRRWSAAPDFLLLLYQSMLERKPGVVVEAGSGLSSLIAGYAAREIGNCRIISLESDEKYAKVSKADVAAHGLQDIVTVVYAPLVEHQIDGRAWKWYDTTALSGLDRVDLVIVDGPPAGTQPLARYPAVPVLAKLVRSEAIVLLDDGSRPDETAIASRWQNEAAGSRLVQFTEFERGAYKLHLPVKSHA